MIKQLLRDLAKFILRPNTNPIDFSNVRYPMFTKTWITLLLIIPQFFVGLILASLLNQLFVLMGFVSPEIDTAANKLFFDSVDPVKLVLIGALYIPILEELIFRLPLRFSKLHWSISMMLLYLSIQFPTKVLFVEEIALRDMLVHFGFGSLIFMSIYGMMSFQWVNDWLLSFGRTHFRWLFYVSILAFALPHFDADEFSIFFLSSTMPQFVGGLVSGYVRVKFGFGYSVIKHVGVNLPATLAISLG